MSICKPVLEAEKQFIEAAKRNDVESMRTLGKGLNANAKNMVGLRKQHFITLHTQTQKGDFVEFCKNLC